MRLHRLLVAMGEARDRARGIDAGNTTFVLLSLVRSGRRTARRFVWDRVVDNLVHKVEFLAARQGARPAPSARVGSAPARRRGRRAEAALVAGRR